MGPQAQSQLGKTSSHSAIAPQSPVARFALSLGESAMADLRGESPNLSDPDVFKELERWEAILQTMPELYEDDAEDCDEDIAPPDLTPDL